MPRWPDQNAILLMIIERLCVCMRNWNSLQTILGGLGAFDSFSDRVYPNASLKFGNEHDNGGGHMCRHWNMQLWEWGIPPSLLTAAESLLSQPPSDRPTAFPVTCAMRPRLLCGALLAVPHSCVPACECGQICVTVM